MLPTDAPENIKAFREGLQTALAEAGLEAVRLPQHIRGTRGWYADEVVRAFVPQEIRRPWGFRLYGYIVIELPPLRSWLESPAAIGAPGIFHTDFVGYHIANDNWLGGMASLHGDIAPFADWAERIRSRLSAIPTSIDELTHAYRNQPSQLGHLVSSIGRPAWEFLLRWREDPSRTLPVPNMLPDGRIVCGPSAA